MNKQQLAAKIWASANQMRSKIDANEYKDYILGFIFYKFLSDTEEAFLKKQGMTEEEMPTQLKEENKELVKFCQDNIGYFIAYDNLNSTWLNPNYDFRVSSVSTALSAFSRLISPTYKKVFDGIFITLDKGLSNLGGAKEINDLLQLIRDIPTDDKQDYDVLGFIYEYLISNFAANAGKKAGEFYTPHEVALLMAEIVAHHSQNKKELSILDPTSGSGSLLINIGRAVMKYMQKDKIKYYAQELKENTYNLTRMNLVMRGVNPANIITRRGDTLEDDWPLFDETDRENTYEHLMVDAVVSNPPYSQPWSPKNKEADPRYSHFGIAPKSKADYAFLLHDLYHIKPDGIMTIVLPHGVLFRGRAGKTNEQGIQEIGDGEYEIRKNLIEYNHIDTIIGLPENIFYGTTIPTIIMVLKQKRTNSDVLIIDASKGFEKTGKNNRLRARDIKRIADVVAARITIPKFSKVVSRDEIRQNGYNLNIPRYVDSVDATETWDIYASMFGGIPATEIDELINYWNAFPSLREEIFSDDGTPIAGLKTDDIESTIENNADVKKFIATYHKAFENLSAFLISELVEKAETVVVSREEGNLSADLFERLKNIKLIDRYEAFQLLDNQWQVIGADLEMIQSEGYKEATQKVDPNMVIKKKDNKDVEVQEGWKGHIMPFELVQKTLLSDDFADLKRAEENAANCEAESNDVFATMNAEALEKITDEDGKLVKDALKKYVGEIFDTITTPEIETLIQYTELSKKGDKIAFVEKHKEIAWDGLAKGKDGTILKSSITDRIDSIKYSFQFEDDSDESQVLKLSKLLEQLKELKNIAKEKDDALHTKTKSTIETLNKEQIHLLLELKWIRPLCTELTTLPHLLINDFEAKVKTMAEKYAVTYSALIEEGKKAEGEIQKMISDLTGSDFDMKGLQEFEKTLKGQ